MGKDQSAGRSFLMANQRARLLKVNFLSFKRSSFESRGYRWSRGYRRGSEIGFSGSRPIVDFLGQSEHSLQIPRIFAPAGDFANFGNQIFPNFPILCPISNKAMLLVLFHYKCSNQDIRWRSIVLNFGGLEGMNFVVRNIGCVMGTGTGARASSDGECKG